MTLKDNKTQQKQEKGPKKQEKSSGEHLIYIGPNLQGGVLTQYATFRGGLPGHVKQLAEQNDAVNGLIVPVAGLAPAQSRVRTPGSLEYRYYQTLLNDKEVGR